VFEKFTKESTSLLDELALINNGSDKGNEQEKERSVDLNFLPSVDPETVLQTGHELLSELQQRRFNGSDGGVSWSPMDDELLAQPQVMKLLDSLREQYTRYQEVCRQRSKRTQLEEIQQKVMQVVNWLEGPGSEQLRAQWGIGDSIRASQALQQKHEEVESQHSEWFAVYVELNQQIAALLNAGDEEDLVELKSLQQQLSDVCYRQASQLEFRQNLLQAALEFHAVAQDLSQQLDGLLGMLCVDVAPADGASIQQTLKLLEEKLKSVDVGLQGLREKGQGLLDQISNQASWAYGKDVTIENKENVDHIQGVMEDMQLRKQRCEDMVDVRRLKMLQMVQLFKCEEDASQAVEWLSELLDALLKTHIRLGDDAQETKVLLEKHRKFVDVAQSTYDYGRQLLQATVVLCQSLRCTSRSSGDTLPRLNRVWKQFTVASEERVHRLEMAIAFHSNAEKILQDCPEEPEGINDEEQFEEIEAVGKSLLDRLTVPVVYPDGSSKTALPGAESQLYLTQTDFAFEVFPLCGKWVQLQVAESQPNLLEIGSSQDETKNLLRDHELLLAKLKALEDRVWELLQEADRTAKANKAQSQVYDAMAQTLGEAWATLVSILEKRRELLGLTSEFFESALEFAIKIDQAEAFLQNPHEFESTEALQSLLQLHDRHAK
ncbi:hypothetical protein STEG23_017982, partial [Scotinomys teguina]